MSMAPTRIRHLHPNIQPRCLRRAAAAEYVGVSVNTFDSLVKGGFLPGARRLGNILVWDRVELDAVIGNEQSTVTDTSWADIDNAP